MFSPRTRRTLLILLGFLLVAAFIWYAGPYFAFADYHPLESVAARLIAIVVVVLFWMGSVLLHQLRAYRASDRLAAAVVQQAASDQSRPSAEAAQLRERFEGAVGTLKQTRRSGHSLYELPWYVIIGAPGSGKTTALLNSGLKFPLEQRVGKGALRGVGGTRNCDWWFTDEAVFLDTAGRYTTQDSDAASDSAGWLEFLGLLRKYRKRRPVNGIILTVSAQDLMVQGHRGREAHVEAARRRLNEVNKELHIQLPVYVMVTKCDLVAGFSEYFDDLTQEGRAQVWGVTFPYDQTLSGETTQEFPAEFDELMTRLNAKVFARIEEDRDVRRRTQVFAFPQQMAALREMLAQFVSEVFGSTRFDRQILLRGVYLTSGTQEGTPIDRLLGAIGRRFGVAPEAVALPGGRGKAYFVERLLKDVMIGESGLAGVNRRVELQKAAWQLGGYAAMALAAVIGFIVLSVSYSRNQAYVADVAATVEKLKDTSPVASVTSLEALLPRLNAIRAVVDTADRHREDPPWGMRWGLFQGISIGNSARDAYVRELNGVLLPRIAGRIKERLGEYAAQPERLYEYLKAYIMLGDPRHVDTSHLQFVADLEWKPSGGAPSGPGVPLSTHFQSLLEYAPTLRPVALDPSLLARARSTIRQESIPRIMYNRLKRTYADDKRAVRLDVAAGVGVEQVIRRKSGISLSDPVPALYGRDVFKEATGTGMVGLVKQFAGDAWVLGDSSLSGDNPLKLAANVTNVYERDYIAAWEAILDDLELVSFSTVTETVNALDILSRGASPLRGLLTAVVDNTALAAPPSPSAAPPAEKSLKDRVLGDLFSRGKEATGLSEPTPGMLVTAHFQPIHRMMAGEPGNTPLDRVLNRIGEIRQQLGALGPDVGGANPLDVLTSPVLRGMLQSLRQDAASLPPVIENLVSQIGRKAEVSVISGATSELERRYAEDVLRECTDVVEGRFPFSPGSTNDVPLADFGRLLGYDGVFDAFFNQHLAPLVDTSESPWKWRPGAVRPARDILGKFEETQRVREMFFRRGSRSPEMRVTVTLAGVDPSASRFTLEVDGREVLDSRSPGRHNQVIWPGPNPGQTAVTFEDSFSIRHREAVHGAWSWFRLFDGSKRQRETDVRFLLNLQVSGYSARVIVDTSSIHNPLADRSWQRFTCGF